MDSKVGSNQDQLCDLFARDAGGMGGNVLKNDLAADLHGCRRATGPEDLWRDAVRRHSDARAHWRSLLGQHLVPHPIR